MADIVHTGEIIANGIPLSERSEAFLTASGYQPDATDFRGFPRRGELTRGCRPVFPLDIPTPDDDPNVTHPDVLYVPEGFNGYPFWMVYTPFPDDAREVPCLVASHDGVTWEVPEGCPFPLITNDEFRTALGSQFAFNSDPDMVRLPNGDLAIYMRPTKSADGAIAPPYGEWLIRITSADGITWSPIEVCAETAVGDDVVWRAPAVVVEPDGTFKMWTTGVWLGTDERLLYRTSTDGITWSAPFLCTVPGSLLMWHADVVRTDDGVYHLLGDRDADSALYAYWTSTDGITWSAGFGGDGSINAIPILDGIDTDARYRPTFQPVAGNPYRFHVWMCTRSVGGTNTWRIAAFLPNYQLGGHPSDLHVRGDVYANGYQAIGLRGTTRTSVVAGRDAGKSVDYTTVADQVAIGYRAGESDSGTEQVAIGASAGRSNTGTQQTAVGTSAGVTNTGANQAALGYWAGRLNTGTQQTAVGYKAGNQNSGARQTALGYQAGQDNNQPDQTALGHDAGRSNTGSEQTAVGVQAGVTNQGARQTAVGYWAGRLNTGANIAALGYQALNQNTGANCVAIGERAGSGNTGANCVFIGRAAGLSNATDNRFVLLQSAVSATPLIDGDFSTRILKTGNLTLDALPTSNPTVAGRLWNDGGTVKVSAG